MTDESVMQIFREAYKGNFTKLNLSNNELTQLPPEIAELKNLIELDLSFNQLSRLPPEIGKLKSLKTLILSFNQLTQLPAEVGELRNLTTLILAGNQLNRLPQEIRELKNLTILSLAGNQLNQLPPEIIEFKNLMELDLSFNQLNRLPENIAELKNLATLVVSGKQLTQLPPEITELENLTALHLYGNELNQLPPEIGELKNLKTLLILESELNKLPPEIGKLKNLTTLVISAEVQEPQLRKEIPELSVKQLHLLPPEIRKLKNLRVLELSGKQLIQLPPEVTELKNLIELNLSYNQLSQLPPDIGKLKNLTTLILAGNQLNQLPLEIRKLKSLKTLILAGNQLNQLPPEITELENLTILDLSSNPLTSPPQEIASMGVEATFTYLKQSKTTEHNEAKLILVGNGEVGKTCLAHRLTTNEFVECKVTEGINISRWSIPAPGSKDSEIKLNIWDFGGQEIYHATQQFFLTTRSVYLLVWDARKTKNYDSIYYWLHTIEAFGEDSPIILVMSKMNEYDDDLNLKDLKNKFPQITGYLKIDSKDGKGISVLKEKIRETAWGLPLMKARWVGSWYKVREKLEGLKENWIPYQEFYNICVSEGLDDKNIVILDEYLHELGVILHFKDRIALSNIVILKPEWATGALYKILSTKSVLLREGILLNSELDRVWDTETYPSSVYPQLMDLMNKFELAYELPEEKSYLIPELLPKNEPSDFTWDKEDNLCFYYCYDYFLPPGIITRLIVRMHQDIEKKENGLPLCWREGMVLKLQNSRALVEMKPYEKQIEIRTKGDNKRGTLGAICNQLDQINASIKKIKIIKEVPCNCSENCSQRYTYEDLLKAEINNLESIQCHESYKHVSISFLLDGYKRREERFIENNEISRQLGQPFVFSPNIITNLEAKTLKLKPEDNIININIDLKIDLPQIRVEFDNLKEELENLNPKLDSDLDKIQDILDEISTNSDGSELVKPLNKLSRFLVKLSDPDSNYNKVIKGTEKGIELAQKLGKTYNKFAQWLAMPQVPDLFLGK